MAQVRHFCAWLVAVLAVAAPATALASGRSMPVELTYRPVMQSDGSGFAGLQVTVRFQGDASGQTEIELPHEWGGAVELGRNISGLAVTGARMSPGKEPHIRLLRHQPGAAITLRYLVEGGGFPRDPVLGRQGSAEYHPIFEPDYFHLLGNAVMVRLTHLQSDHPVRFRLAGMPQGARFASDLEHDGLTLSGAYQSIAVGGDVRLITVGKNARLAVRGAFDSRDDAGWAEAFGKVTLSVQEYWQTDGGTYLVTILGVRPPEPGWVSAGGTGLGDAFAFFATTNADVDTLDRVMAHEKHHSWLPREIGGFDPATERESEAYWLSEGFTEFVTHRGLVRGGLWSPARFVEQFNRDLKEYDALSVRALPNRDSAPLFWSSAEGQRLPYLRGMLFASWLDRELRRHSGGAVTLRQVLLRMQHRTQELRSAGQEPVPAIKLLRRETAALGLDLTEAMARYIEQGEPIALPTNLVGPCGRFSTEQRPVYELGFDGRRTADNGQIVTGVEEGSAAWQAGLRNGMTMIGRTGGVPGDSTSEASFVVEADGTQRTLRWLPAGREPVTVRRVILDDAQTEACRSYLSA